MYLLYIYLMHRNKQIIAFSVLQTNHANQVYINSRFLYGEFLPVTRDPFLFSL